MIDILDNDIDKLSEKEKISLAKSDSPVLTCEHNLCLYVVLNIRLKRPISFPLHNFVERRYERHCDCKELRERFHESWDGEDGNRSIVMKQIKTVPSPPPTEKIYVKRHNATVSRMMSSTGFEPNQRPKFVRKKNLLNWYRMCYNIKGVIDALMD